MQKKKKKIHSRKRKRNQYSEDNQVKFNFKSQAAIMLC